MRVPTASNAARLDRFLAREEVVWLSTVRPDGTPHLVPIWFTWDGTALLVLSKPHAQKVRNLRANPVAMLALGEPEEDFDVALVEARVELVDGPLTELPPGHLAKYGSRMAALGLSADEFLSTYSQLLRITPVRTLSWHGRTTPRSLLEAATTAVPTATRAAPTARTRPDFGRALRALFGASPAPSRAAAAAG
ncbi:MAG TPA: pyridoxamine 5'-phosphate oxidase family protein [Clostridia bacterium]|nr:pyridoxamine 5'-phosphate oxidase family protein [Clostridia bacterium]